GAAGCGVVGRFLAGGVVMRGARPTSSILWLGEPACNDPLVVGGKAASLSRLAARYPVPPGFALTTALFDRASRHKDAEEAEKTPVLSAGLRRQIAAAYRQLGERACLEPPPVAVRSSAVHGDGRDASCARLH